MLGMSSSAAQDELVGTYRLISTTQTMLDTGQAEVLNHTGFIMYGRDGRMMTILLTGERPTPTSVAKIIDQERIQLFRSMTAYGGVYKFDGTAVEHHIDISSNGVWTGTTHVRDVKREGDRLILITRPAPNPFDGKMVTATLVWEKMQ